MELTGLRNETQTTVLQGTVGDAASQSPASTASATKSLLSGDSLSVRSSSDFEKLLAEMESKRDKALQKSFKSQFAAAMSVLTGRHEGLSAAQQAAMEKVTAATDTLSQAQADVDAAQTTYDASVDVLAEMTEKLEAMVEASVTTPEDRVDEIQQEEVREEETREDQLQEELKYTDEEIQAQRDAIAAQQQVVDANRQALQAATDAKTQAQADLTAALKALDSSSKRLVVEAVVISSRLLAAASAESGDAVTETHVSGIVEAIGEYADKIQEMQDEELEEAIAKITPELLFLVTADYTISPSALPQYEEKV